ncbi:EmrB/QacA subfamily drug resistance transporter [Leucobacter luti]|uniref:MFS transporter n=1 Tax=Leucobacter luti TaxID=340320 RepID=UPI001046C886|nr:MFS transporter [Leucobacter luti]MCW2288529.1 EmrB/QacA subfamily drug resistance transporter [Leucobacter luti]TCK45315.1 EmrB/QacA subfamily drug resistance transporter [Leucobacter luti]
MTHSTLSAPDTGSVPTVPQRSPATLAAPAAAPEHETARGADPRRWWALAVIALTQLVVVLDGTIVNIALPQAQLELGMSDAQRGWVVTAYALVFGALLLLGGRIADFWGRKRAFMLGMVGFGAASLYGGLAQNTVDLIIARGLQGLFAALLAPAALALLTVTFPSGRERNTAFAVYGAVAGSGAAVGLLLGGFLTEFTSWRWCLLVNLVFVAVAVLVGSFVLSESRAPGRARFDVWGAVTVTGGFGFVVYGLTLAESGWLRVDTIGCLVGGVALLVAFVWIESHVAEPLLPLRILRNRVRAGAFLVQAALGALLIGSTMYLAFHLQLVLGFAPLVAGFASVVMTAATLVVVPLFTRLLPVWGPRAMLVAGPLGAACGMFWLSFITADGSYAVQVLPGLLLVGAGVGITFVPLQNLALVGVAPADAGAASATVNAAMQLGGSIGLSAFALAATGAAQTATAAGASPAEVLASSYGAVFFTAAIVLVLGAIVAFVCVRGSKEELLPSHA